MRQQQQAGENHGPERIDMLQGVEADPAELPGGIVAELVGTKAWAASWKVMAIRSGKYPDRNGV